MTAGLPDPLGEPAFCERRTDHPDAVRLLRSFYEEQVGRYGFAESVDLDPEMYVAPAGVFVVVDMRGEPVGCGACRWYDRVAGTVEIKKTYLSPTLRGRGIGQALLAWLEARAAGWGARRVILETGVRNTAALELFARRGYRPTARYVPGRDPAINRAFAKPLTKPGSPPTNATGNEVRTFRP